MNQFAIDIDRLVSEVLADLGTAPQQPPPANRGLGTSVTSKSSDALTITSRVVTIDSLKGRLDGVRRLCVPRGAVLTPAVRDELRRGNIALEYAEQNHPATTAARLHIVVAAANYDPAAMLEALKREGFPCKCNEEKCLIAATDGLAREISGGDALGLLLTEHAAAALCLLNRLSGVRAVGDPVAAASVGANAMVLDPRRMSLFQIKRLAADFLRGGVRECPKVFKERLG